MIVKEIADDFKKKMSKERRLPLLEIEIYMWIYICGFPGGSVVEDLTANSRDRRNAGLIPGLGKSPGIGNGMPLQYPCLENPMDRGAWQATVHGVIKTWTWLRGWAHSTRTHIYILIFYINNRHTRWIFLLHKELMPVDNNSSDSVFWHYPEEEPQITNIYFKTMIRFSHKRLT